MGRKWRLIMECRHGCSIFFPVLSLTLNDSYTNCTQKKSRGECRPRRLFQLEIWLAASLFVQLALAESFSRSCTRPHTFSYVTRILPHKHLDKPVKLSTALVQHLSHMQKKREGLQIQIGILVQALYWMGLSSPFTCCPHSLTCSATYSW